MAVLEPSIHRPVREQSPLARRAHNPFPLVLDLRLTLLALLFSSIPTRGLLCQTPSFSVRDTVISPLPPFTRCSRPVHPLDDRPRVPLVRHCSAHGCENHIPHVFVDIPSVSYSLLRPLPPPIADSLLEINSLFVLVSDETPSSATPSFDLSLSAL